MATAAGGPQWHLDRGAIESGCSGWECGVVEVLGEQSVVLLAIAVGLAVFLSVAILREAADSIAEERECVTCERDAFRAFAERIERLQPVNRSVRTEAGERAGAASVRIASGGSSGGNAGIEAVETAYRETVMAMEHYDEEYDESLVENVAAELGSDVATAIATGEELTPGLRDALVSEAHRAAKRREVLLAQLEDEIDRIGDARRAIQPLEGRIEAVERDLEDAADFHDGASAWNRLSGIEAELESELHRQQERLDPDAHPAEEPHVFCTYLYGDGTAEYPVLSAIGRLLDRADEAKRSAVAVISGDSPPG
ncbi:MAG: hypothetical protein V5A46_06530 [Haloferacaceae archaeon]